MFDFIRNYFERRRLQEAASRIPEEAYQLIDSINSRYSQLYLNEGEFAHLDGREKLSRLIEMINQDVEIARLNSLAQIGSVKTVSQQVHSGFHAGSGLGVNLCIGEEGLFIYDWDDLKDRHKELLADSGSLAKYDPGLDAETLKRLIADHAERKTYEKRVLDFNMFQR